MRKYWDMNRSEPARPDRRQIGRQRRQAAEFGRALAWCVKVRSARCLETEAARDPRIFGILVRRVAAGHHFDRLAAELLERREQFVEFERRVLVAARVRDDRPTAPPAD